MAGLTVEHEQASPEVSDALRAAKHWRLYQEAQVENAGLSAAVGFEKGRADAAERALAEARSELQSVAARTEVRIRNELARDAVKAGHPSVIGDSLDRADAIERSLQS